MRSRFSRRPSRSLFSAIVCASVALVGAPAIAQTTPPSDPKLTSVTTRGGRWDWGASVSLLRIGALRDPTLPGRTHQYQTDIRPLDTQVTFQAFFHPAGTPWRRTDERTLRDFQLLSLSAFLTLGIDPQHSAQSEIALGVGLGLFENFLVLGLGFDLYRGVPVRGGDGVPGSHTASTGLLAPLTSTEGEVTPENFFFVIHLNLVSLVRSTQ